jgi:hypothetical protein
MDDRPQSPRQLNRTRLVIIALVVLALVTILGATLGGSLTGYQQLREATPAQGN